MLQVVGPLIVSVCFGLVGLQNLPQLALAAHLVSVFSVVSPLILLAGLLVERVVAAGSVVFVVLHPETLPVLAKAHNPIIFSHRGIYTRARAGKKATPTRSLLQNS